MNWDAYLAALHRFIQTHQLLVSGQSALLAVSGGIDSILLLEGFAALAQRLALSRLGAVYVDHGLRPDQTPEEAAFVESRARHHGMECFVGSIQIEVQGGSLQDAARQARRALLEELAHEGSWDRIATGHHRDDQAETLLLRLLRGTSSDGLAGIAPQAGIWIHPLLPFSRAQLAQLAQQRQLSWREDPTNRTTHYLRNQLRLQLLPQLEREYNPQLRPQLARMAEQLRQDQRYFRQQLEAHFRPPLVQRSDEHALILDLESWDALPYPLQWRCLRRAVVEFSGDAVPLAHIELMMELCQSRHGEKRLSLPGQLWALRSYGQLRLQRAQEQEALGDWQQEAQLCEGESLELQCPSGRLIAWALPHPDAPQQLEGPKQAFFEGPMSLMRLRYRQPGDILPLEIGRRPLKKWMIDAKIPKSQRSAVPLLEIDGALCWVIGHRRLWPLQKHRPSRGWWLRFEPGCDESESKAYK